MSAITPNPLATGFAPSGPAIDFERPAGNAFASAILPSVRERSDAILNAPPWGDGQIPPPTPVEGGPGFGGPWFGGPGFGAPTGGFGNIMNLIFAAISNLFAGLGSMFSGLPPQPSPYAPQQYFTDANATSLGDPHLAFSGTTGAGASVGSHWDSMSAHADLLRSDSFAGGYRVATTVTQPSASGVTLNDSVDVATNGGNTNVVMHKDGSYDVTEDGRHVALQTGRAVSVGGGESVTLDPNGALVVNDTTGTGGSITTTIARNGSGGLDVSNSAHDVDLGGYLVEGSGGTPLPVAFGGSVPSGVPSSGASGFSNVPFDVAPFTAQPYDSTSV